MKFEMYKDKAGKYRFRLKAGNGQIVLASESYESKSGCKNGKYYFNLRAGNNQVIGTSEMYESESGRDNGIESVKNSAKGATIEEVE